ncbi:Ribonucleotide reductase of class II (coenzyme B12-dependent) [hydrothermal vent metagenome]|uniref:Vitamin B12-dependent ribonucleotide reductase n=1 Tax=hydrothermal vent metagenome TaxID=652676 RepID=A0A3B0UZB7_9ZZZZ
MEQDMQETGRQDMQETGRDMQETGKKGRLRTTTSPERQERPAGKVKAFQKGKATAAARKPADITDNARSVLERRYLKKDRKGNPVETPDDMLWRVSCNIAEGELLSDPQADVEAVAGEFYDMISSLEFLPNSPTLMNAGRDLQQLSACFVLPVEDSMESIFETLKHTALIHKSGGGTGFSFSSLRPSGDVVGSTSGISSGPISFMSVFDSATEAIKQGGTRRGANMGMLRIDHPDVMKFITCKEDSSKLNNFNISVALTEEFMGAVDSDTDYAIKSPRTGKTVGHLNAREVFDKVVTMAWKNGDPGIIFIDRINRDNPTPQVGNMDATNPCGEQPLLPYESCNLGSINLTRMIRKSAASNGVARYEVDWNKLGETTEKAVHFLDNVIDMNRYPIPEIKEKTRSNRKIGLGVMGFSDMLIRLGIPYNSDEGVELAEKVMGFIREKGHAASRRLAVERGAFPNFKGSIYDDGKEGSELRNATVTTIAPTGTISIIAACSSGIEPLFALAFTRNVMEGTELLEVNPLFEEVARERGFYSPELMRKIAESGGLHAIDELPEDVKKVFVTAHDISPEWHIKMQAAFQGHIDNAVSKTVNFPNEATEEDVANAYMLSYKLGCKGITVYRDGSRDIQVLTRGSEKKADKAAASEAEAEAEAVAAAPAQEPRVRGEVAFGLTRKMKTGCGNLYVTLNEDAEGHPVEIFTQMGKAGGCATSQCEAIGRMASLALRGGIQAEEIVSQMRGISCHLPTGFGSNKVLSCSDAMAQAMEWYLRFKHTTGASRVVFGPHSADGAMMGEGSGDLSFTFANDIFKRGACPDCGGTVEHADGCVVCRGCGYSECG